MTPATLLPFRFDSRLRSPGRRVPRRRTHALLLGLVLAVGPLAACDGDGDDGRSGDGVGYAGDPAGAEGTVQVALMAAPADAACLRLSAAGSRTVTRLSPLTPGASTTFTLDRLPIGIATVDAQAFPTGCGALTATSIANWVTESPVNVRVDAAAVAQVSLRLIRNGRLSVGIDFEDPPWVSAAAEPVDLAVIGDSPYGAAQLSDFPALVASINADPAVSTVVHLGDIKNGSTRCDTSYFETIAADFAGLQDPLIYTPGDNEWTDCHRANNGAYDPLERLATLRRLFFPQPGLALGGGRKQVLSQATLTGFEPFVENQIWLEAQVAFGAVHVVGSNNGRAVWFGDDTTGTKLDDPTRRLAEVEARTTAALDWIDRTFALAASRGALGVVLLMQADMWDATARLDGFDAIAQRIAERARAFARPVLLFEGDSHVFVVDNPFAAGDPVHGVAAPVPNLTRIIVQGQQTTEWLRLHVDPRAGAPALFSWQRVAR